MSRKPLQPLTPEPPRLLLRNHQLHGPVVTRPIIIREVPVPNDHVSRRVLEAAHEREVQAAIRVVVPSVAIAVGPVGVNVLGGTDPSPR